MSLFLPAIQYIYFDLDKVLAERVENRSQLVARLLNFPDSLQLRDFYYHGFLEDLALQAEYVSLQSVESETTFYQKLFIMYAGRAGIPITDQQAATTAQAFVGVPMHVKDGVRGGLERLKQQYGLGILTNGLPSRREELAASGLQPYFTSSIISCDYGVEKPAAAIYEIAAKAAHLEPSAIALVDDEQQNIEGALRANYGQAVLFTPEFWQQVQPAAT